MVGAARSRLLRSVTLPPAIGTLKSTRSSTVLPARSRSSRVLNFGIAVSLKGSGGALAAGAPECREKQQTRQDERLCCEVLAAIAAGVAGGPSPPTTPSDEPARSHEGITDK